MQQFYYLDGPSQFNTFFWSGQFDLLTVKGVGYESCHIERLQISSYWWTSQSILKLKYLFIDNYKGYGTC